MSPSALVAPPGLIRVDGEWVPRRIGYVAPNTSLVCWRGHEIDPRADVVDGLGAHQCRWQSNGMHGQCGWVVGVVEGSAAGSYRFHLTADEWSEIQRRGWRAAQVLEYVGATLTLSGGGAA